MIKLRSIEEEFLEIAALIPFQEIIRLDNISALI